jgi:hypothetical protein
VRKHLPLFSRLGLLSGAVIVLVAQTEHITPFTGTWKLNLAKSNFNPGPPFKSFTITFTPDGTRHLELVGADGQPIKVLLPWSDGKKVHVTGTENATAISKNSRQHIPRHLETEWKDYRGCPWHRVFRWKNFDGNS